MIYKLIKAYRKFKKYKMKSTGKAVLNTAAILMFAVILLSGRPAFGTGEGDSLFTGIKIHTMNIRFSQPNYWDSLVFYYEQGLEQYMSATVIANGITYNNVGIRLKGNSSYTHPNNKKPFRLSFNEFVSGQRWNGLKGVHLNNFWNDPTFIREKLHLDYCKDVGIVAPRANFVRLSINDTLFAFYSLIEHVDKTFLSNNLGSTDGDQFKAVDAYGATSHLVSDFRWYGSDTTEYLSRYEMKSELFTSPWRRLVNFIDSINHTTNPYYTYSSLVNTNRLYKAMAIDILLGNLDSYVYNGRNFYTYAPPPLYKFNWIVWDASLSFGALPGGISNIESLPVTYVNSDTGRPLFGRVVTDPRLKQDYLMAFCSIFSEYFTTGRLFPKIDSMANLIRPYVYEDPRKMYSNSQFETNITNDLVIAGNRKPGLKSYIQTRRTNVLNQLNTLGINCEIGINGSSEQVKGFELYQNYPNPFNPTTKISYELQSAIGGPGYVSLKVYDILGNEVAVLVNERMNPGNYSVEFDAENLPSGLYFYTLKSADKKITRKMLLIK